MKGYWLMVTIEIVVNAKWFQAIKNQALNNKF